MVPLNIPTPTPAPCLGGPVAYLGGPVAYLGGIMAWSEFPNVQDFLKD